MVQPSTKQTDSLSGRAEAGMDGDLCATFPAQSQNECGERVCRALSNARSM